MKDKYIITITDRYEVEADSPEHALGLYRVAFDNASPEVVGLPNGVNLDSDQFEYLDGHGEAVKSI